MSPASAERLSSAASLSALAATTPVPASVRARLAAARRVVIKAGTNVLLRPDGHLALGTLYGLVEAIARLQRAGRDVLFVSSGAIGLGAERLAGDAAGVGGAGRRPSAPRSSGLTRAYAAVGQSRLMALYDHGFAHLGVAVAQVLVTDDDMALPARRRQLRATIETLFRAGVVPVLNENDAVAAADAAGEALETPEAAPTTKARAFGDNDMLAALAASLVEADILLLLSDVDGLYTANPARLPDAALLSVVHAITPDILAAADGQGHRGRGGMAGKLAAAQVALASGILTIFANGRRVDAADLLAGPTTPGTIFLPPGFETETAV